MCRMDISNIKMKMMKTMERSPKMCQKLKIPYRCKLGSLSFQSHATSCIAQNCPSNKKINLKKRLHCEQMIRNKTNAITTNDDDDGDDGSGDDGSGDDDGGTCLYTKRVLDAQQIRRIFETNKKIEVKNASVDGRFGTHSTQHSHCHLYIHIVVCVSVREYELACERASVRVDPRSRASLSLCVCVYARPYRHFKCALKPRD